MGMRYMVLAALVVMGCADRGLPETSSPSSGGQHSLEPQCIWHFTWSAGGDIDTSDSDETPGVSSCSSGHLSLNDGVLEVEVKNGVVISYSMCSNFTSTPVGSDDKSWFIDVRGCGVEGFFGVNLR